LRNALEQVYDGGMSTSPTVSLREARQRVLWERTASVAGRLNRAQAELVQITAELIEDRHWGDGGFKTPAHYLVVRAGLSPEHAADLVRIATRRAELPDAAAALDAGQLSLDQVAVLARRVPAGYQASATDLARHATVPQLRRAVARHAFPHPQPGDNSGDDTRGTDDKDQPEHAEAAGVTPDTRSESERRACARPELSMRYDDDGRFQLRYSAPGHIGALVEQAIREAKDALFTATRDGGSSQPSGDTTAPPCHSGRKNTDRDWKHSGRPSHADALAEMAHRSLSTVTNTGRASHYRVYLHLSTDGAWIGGGHAIPTRLLARFLTDGILQPIWETQGRPVSVGRAMRILPERTRRLILDRDRGCRFPGCTTSSFLEIHHLHPWADGGGTDEDNQIALCTHHHDGIDRGDYTITGDPTRPDGLSTLNRYGIPIRPPTAEETSPPPCGDPAGPEHGYAPPSGGPIAWSDTELSPDTELPGTAAVLSLVPRDHTPPEEPDWPPDHPDDALVYDSYRHGRHGLPPTDRAYGDAGVGRQLADAEVEAGDTDLALTNSIAGL
jgi:hypothetical protein